MCGVNGKKFPGVRAHMQRNIGDVYSDMDLTCETFPADDAVDPEAYVKAASTFKRGDVAIIFTPDDTHYSIATCCIAAGMHVMVTKPVVKTLAEHTALASAASAADRLCCVEVHKRLDPFYADARDRVRSSLGNFQYIYAYMSQPKHQLETFGAWAGKSSDISYYLNSHHVDLTEWTLHGRARPERVTATASTGVASSKGIETEDSITLTVQWKNVPDGTMGCAVYTSSWVAPRSDVHSQQRFFYMGSKGEINVDQAHRGCTLAQDGQPFLSVNPLFMKYTPTAGKFAGQGGYGVKSFEVFVDACIGCNAGTQKPGDYDDGSLATIHTTYQGSAILEAGRRSLDADGQPMDIVYDGVEGLVPTGINPHEF